MSRDDPDLPETKDDPPTARKVVPAVLFAVGILVVIFLIFALFEWLEFPT